MPSPAFKATVLGLGAGVGAYFSWVGLQIAGVAREERQLLKAVQSAEAAARNGEAQQAVEAAAQQRLQEQLAMQQQEVSTLEQELQVAQQRVTELEDMRTARVKTAAETERALHEAGSKLERLVAEVRRHRESATASQKELGAAHNRVLEKRQLTNPLNAPLLKGVLGRQ